MIRGFKIVTCSPVGRRRYVEIQVRYLLKMRYLIDKHIFWINTENKEDLEYFDNLVKQYPDFFETIKLEYIPKFGFRNQNVHRFYEFCNDPDTIYCKIDDDIVYIETEKFEEFINFRIDNPQYFLVYPNIINNGLNFFIHRKIGAFEMNEFCSVEYSSTNLAWSNYAFGMFSFEQFQKNRLSNSLDKMKFDKWILNDYERHSINFISWFGYDFINLKCGEDDEKWLSVWKPAELSRPNCIYGKFLVAHYAFTAQREQIDAMPEVLQFFDRLSREN